MARDAEVRAEVKCRTGGTEIKCGHHCYWNRNIIMEWSNSLSHSQLHAVIEIHLDIDHPIFYLKSILPRSRCRAPEQGEGQGGGGQTKVPKMTKSDLIVTNIDFSVNKSALSVNKSGLSVNKSALSVKKVPSQSQKKCPFSQQKCPSDLPAPLSRWISKCNLWRWTIIQWLEINVSEYQNKWNHVSKRSVRLRLIYFTDHLPHKHVVTTQ